MNIKNPIGDFSFENPTFCLWIFFCSATSVTRFSRAIATSWVSVLSGGDSGESESFSLSSLLILSFLLSARHFLLRLLCSCSQLGMREKCHGYALMYTCCDDIRGQAMNFPNTDSVMVRRCLDVSIWISMLLFSSSIRLLLISICWRNASRSCSLS